MPTYTTVAKVQAELPSGQPEGYTAETWATKIGELISVCSQYVDDNVGSKYPFSYKTNTQKFPDITDEPATPSTIERITRWLVTSDALGYFQGMYNVDDAEVRKKLREKAEYKFRAIQKGEIVISVSGVSLRTSFSYSVNDRADDEDDLDFDRDELDILNP